MKQIALWALVLLLMGPAGCLSPDMKRARAVQESLVGLTQAQVVACAGAPASEERKGDVTVLTFYKRCGMLEQGFPAARGTVAREARHGCLATLEVEGGRVTRARFEAIPDDATYELYHCEELFADCAASSNGR